MLPPDIKHHLAHWFSYSEKHIYCQVATSFEGQPHIRTMNLYDVTPEGNLVFFTDTDSPKWHSLQISPKIAVGMFNPDYGQITLDGRAELKTKKDGLDIIEPYWKLLTEYWLKYYLSRSKNNEIPDLFGVIIVTPATWEILELCKEDFLKSYRKHYELVNGEWVKSIFKPT